MAMRQRAQLLAEDIWDTPDDENRYEVIDGELYMTPPPSLAHQHAVTVLSRHVGAFVDEHQLGDLFVAPVGVILEGGAGVQPDVVFVARERREILSERGLEGAPTLAVEVLSPSTSSRDRGIKMRRYAAAGVEHYWLVDPRLHSLEEYVLRDHGYNLVCVAREAEVFRPLLFPGLEIGLGSLWRR